MPELGPHGLFIDKCMVEDVQKVIDDGFETLGCCCGHGKYAKTILRGSLQEGAIEYFSGVHIPRTRRFYKTDDEGLYFIQEVEDDRKKML